MPQSADDGLSNAPELVELTAGQSGLARVELACELIELIDSELGAHRVQSFRDLIEGADFQGVQRGNRNIELGHDGRGYSNLNQ